MGGFGTRLRPLTYTIPKPLLPIAHVPMIRRLINRLEQGGVTDVVLALGFKPEPFFAEFPNNMCGGVRLKYAVESTPLDTAGAIGFAARSARVTGTFIVANGDVMTDLDVAMLVDFHRRSGARATISLTPVADPSQFGIVETDASGKVLRFVEKPQPGETESRFASAGTYVMEESVLEFMPGTEKLSIERVTFPQLVAQGELFAMANSGYWIDAGRPDTYVQANIDIAAHMESPTDRAIHEQANVSATAHVVDSVIGAGVSVGDHSNVLHSVILEGATIGSDAHVERSIVKGSVGNGARIEDCIVASDGTVEAGSRSVGGRFPEIEQA
ncbi:MAG: sugar phosphate nucleotidyltransferase [Ilumatobacteraceae bacterium]